MPSLKRISQRDLARIARVSHTTVSLALKNDPSISAALREKIHALAAKHNYHPDPALAILNAYRTGKASPSFRGNIVWLTHFAHKNDWHKMLQLEEYFEGARRRALELGYNLEEFWTAAPGISSTRATNILTAKGVRGIIVAPLPQAGNIDLDWSRFSSIALGYSLTSPKLHMIMNHQSRNMRLVIRRLCEMGYRRIGFAMPREVDARVNYSYLSGFLVSQHLLPDSCARIPLLLPEQFDADSFDNWFDQHKPDVVVTAAASVYQVMDWLKKKKLRIPQDVGVAVAVVPFGDSLVSGINENVHLIGATAVDTVVAMIHRNETGIPSQPMRILIEGVWTQGKTIAPQRSKASSTNKRSRTASPR